MIKMDGLAVCRDCRCFRLIRTGSGLYQRCLATPITEMTSYGAITYHSLPYLKNANNDCEDFRPNNFWSILARLI